MDVVREPRFRAISRLLWAAGLCAGLALVSWAAWSLLHSRSAGAVVDRSTLVVSTARRGTLERTVAASGAFLPEQTHVVSSPQDGVVEQVYVKAGAHVSARTRIAVLGNPDLDAAVVDAQAQLSVALADLASAQQEAGAAHLQRESSLADAQSQMQQDRTTALTDRALAAKGLIPALTYRIARIRAEQSARQVSIARAQVGVDIAESGAKVAAARARVAQAESELAAKQAQLASLVVRAGASGVVQEVGVDPGARVTAGTQVATVADQRMLKAVLQVPETQVRDVALGMPVRVDSGNGIAMGRVSRIAPEADNGTVNVDVTFPGASPPGARPDANVDGTIEIARVAHALSIARPAGALEDSSLDLFKIIDGGTRAVRTRVRLGLGSETRIQILAGLHAGDRVIVSDTSAYADQRTLRLR